MKPEQIVEKMRLKDKVALGSGKDYWHTKDFKQYQIPSIKMSDGPHGLRLQVGDVDMIGVHSALPGTCFPTSSTTAASWNTELTRQIGEAIAQEAVVGDVQVVLGPGLNIKRNPLCGRNFEYYSEDPVLSGQLAAGFVQGIQSQGIAACPKHFAANNQEYKRHSSNSVVDERTLREIYLKAFEIVVKEARPKTIMSSYNRINGQYASQNHYLLKDVLREDWKFDGTIVTDWGGMYDRIEAYRAGCDLVMPGGSDYMEKDTIAAVQNGSLNESYIDQSATRILQLIEKTKSRVKPPVNLVPKNHELALQAALESAVLLKNDDQLLPIKPDSKVCLIGHMAQQLRYQGSGSSYINPTKLSQLRDELPHLPFAEGVYEDGTTDDGLIILAKRLAASHHTPIVVVGLPPSYESEGFDRAHMQLPEGHNELIQEVAKVNPNTVVILLSGSPVETPWIDDVKAVLYMGLPGQAGASAIAKLLYGQANPSGRLSETWPKTYEDVPNASYYSHGNKDGEYREGIYVGYRYYEKAQVPVQFPFGFGLSYTNFSYSRLSLAGDHLSFELTNTGSRAGSEVVQLYVSPPQDGIFRPLRELKAFTKIHLAPGETKIVEFTLSDDFFAIWHDGWIVPGGEYQVQIGSDVSHIHLTTVVSMPGPRIEAPWWQAGSWYETLQGEVSRQDWEPLLGYLYHEEVIEKGQFNMGHSLSEMKDHSKVMRLAYWGIEKYINRRIPDKNDSVYQMMLASSADSALSSLQVIGQKKGGIFRSALAVANGQYLKGLKELFR